MAVVANLINPTPFDVSIDYQQGIFIDVPADGEVNITMQQLDDFRPGKPGSEETKKILDFEGVFLQDSNLSYDFQALETLRAYVAEHKDRIRTFLDRTKGSRSQQGVSVDDDVMQELLDQAGYGNMQKKVDKVQARIAILEQLVSTDKAKGSISRTLDPERSCFVTNPPRQFPSKTALNMFLSEHPEIKEKHDALAAPAESTESI
ncbi:hypothetical protein LCGC14_0209160 [marine sediment metagenome]|uniref:Uncharacterized protein n=1 Tax=marine sediment metagenome TaxID=412755 RepID=A0A0F9UGS8_9ZZZZ